MKHTDFKFKGRTYALSFTAEVLFDLYDKFGVVDNIIGATHIFEPTAEGWANCCWLAARMAQQGELIARYMGHEPKSMLQAEELRTCATPAAAAELRTAVRAALEQGFKREIEDNEADEEVNLVLKEREEAKKAIAQGASELYSWLERLRSSITPPEMPSA